MTEAQQAYKEIEEFIGRIEKMIAEDRRKLAMKPDGLSGNPLLDALLASAVEDLQRGIAKFTSLRKALVYSQSVILPLTGKAPIPDEVASAG